MKNTATQAASEIRAAIANGDQNLANEIANRYTQGIEPGEAMPVNSYRSYRNRLAQLARKGITYETVAPTREAAGYTRWIAS